MKRIAIILFSAASTVSVAFFAGILVHDVTHPPVAEASGGSSSGTCQTGSGSRVCSTSPTLTTPNIGAATGTSLTLTQGISGSTGAFSSTVSMGGASTCDRLTCTSTNGGAIAGNGQGTGAGGNFVGGGTDAGGNIGTPGVSGRGGSGGGAGGRFIGVGVYSGVYAECGSGRAATFAGDATSPTYGHFNLNAMDANPSLTPGTVDYAAVSDGTNTYFRQNFYTTIGAWHDVGSALSVSTTNTAFASGGQASATIICDNQTLTVVSTVASAGDSVKFPAAGTAATSPPRGKICNIKNKGANALDLFPASGGTLCVHPNACLAANTATSVAVDDEIECWHQGSDVWNCR